MSSQLEKVKDSLSNALKTLAASSIGQFCVQYPYIVMSVSFVAGASLVTYYVAKKAGFFEQIKIPKIQPLIFNSKNDIQDAIFVYQPFTTTSFGQFPRVFTSSIRQQLVLPKEQKSIEIGIFYDFATSQRHHCRTIFGILIPRNYFTQPDISRETLRKSDDSKLASIAQIQNKLPSNISIAYFDDIQQVLSVKSPLYGIFGYGNSLRSLMAMLGSRQFSETSVQSSHDCGLICLLNPIDDTVSWSFPLQSGHPFMTPTFVQSMFQDQSFFNMIPSFISQFTSGSVSDRLNHIAAESEANTQSHVPEPASITSLIDSPIESQKPLSETPIGETADIPTKDSFEETIEDTPEDNVEESFEESVEETTEETIEESVEEETTEQPVEEPVEEPLEGPIESPVEESPEESTEEPVEETTEEPVEETTEEPVEETTEEPVEESPEEITEEPVEESPEESPEEPVEESPEETIEEPVEESPEEPTEESVEETPEETIEEPEEESPEETTEHPVEEPVEAPEESTEEPLEETTEEITKETLKDIVKDSIEDTSEQTSHQPVESSTLELPSEIPDFEESD